jgi:hypothetical protein
MGEWEKGVIQDILKWWEDWTRCHGIFERWYLRFREGRFELCRDKSVGIDGLGRSASCRDPWAAIEMQATHQAKRRWRFLLNGRAVWDQNLQSVIVLSDYGEVSDLSQKLRRMGGSTGVSSISRLSLQISLCLCLSATDQILTGLPKDGTIDQWSHPTPPKYRFAGEGQCSQLEMAILAIFRDWIVRLALDRETQSIRQQFMNGSQTTVCVVTRFDSLPSSQRICFLQLTKNRDLQKEKNSTGVWKMRNLQLIWLRLESDCESLGSLGKAAPNPELSSAHKLLRYCIHANRKVFVEQRKSLSRTKQFLRARSGLGLLKIWRDSKDRHFSEIGVPSYLKRSRFKIEILNDIDWK